MNLSQTFTLIPFDLRGSDDETYRPLWELSEYLRTERRPEDPPRSLATYINRYRNYPDFLHNELALAHNSAGFLVGYAEAG